MHIYQDLPDPHDGFAVLPSDYYHSGVLETSSSNLNANNIILLEPPEQYPSLSPSKRHSSPISPQPDKPEGGFAALSLPPEVMARFPTDCLEKRSPATRSSLRNAQIPEKALFPTSWPNARSSDKENLYAPVMYREGSASGQSVLLPPKPSLGKHRSSDSVPLRDRSAKKPKVEEEESVELPEPEDMPPLQDDGTKPAYSYATLISMAILRAANRRLTLAQIYKWIQETFSFYKDAETGWMNSIRHNLSLNKAFVKKDRPKDDPGKGCYWTIEEGMEKQFLKDKPARKPASSDIAFFHSMGNDGEDHPLPSIGSFVLPSKPSKAVDSARFPPTEHDISSDATLPASDPPAPEEENDATQSQMLPPSSRVLRSSPPPSHIPSSPPVADADTDDATPPTAQMQSKYRKPRVDNFRDSGFYSSIESSVARPGYGTHTLAGSEFDIERSGIKRGRAEDEIARIRGSSFDQSPTKSKHTFAQPGSSLLPSSPMRQFDAVGFPPLTPGLKFNPARRMPPSTSPNTYLRRHRESVRELIGTPAHGLSVPAEDLAWSPAFKIHEAFNPSPCKSTKDGAFGALTSFDDSFFGEYDAHFARGSPVRASTKRPLLHRANTASSGLKESTSMSEMLRSHNNRLASPIRMLPPKPTSTTHGSPGKGVLARAGAEDAMWGVDLDSEEDETDASNTMDLTRGFRPIVGSTQPRPAARPAMARSITNKF